MQENTMTRVHATHEALWDELLTDYTDPRDILGEHGLLKPLTKRVVERVLERIFPLKKAIFPIISIT
jgi:hypothetical protein